MDTVHAVLENIPLEQLSQLLHHLLKILINRLVFHKFSLLGKFLIIVFAGKGIFIFNKEQYAGCPHRTSKMEKVSCSQSIIEAKLICAYGFSLSIGRKWILNEHGSCKQALRIQSYISLANKTT